MLNKKLKKEAIQELESQVRNYDNKFQSVVSNSEKLHKSRVKSIKHIEKVEKFVNSLANRPMDFDAKFKEIDINKRSFSNEVKKINKEQKVVEVKAGMQAGAGTAVGVGVAALGPSAAMAIATTFGTASTGTAIASLSGAAATNAALAWIGGGALAASGSGMAGGTAFLALAGPVGIAIGGVSIAGAGALAAKKNKKIAEKAEKETRKVKREISGLNKIDVSIESLSKRTSKFLNKNKDLFKGMNSTYPNDYRLFSDEQKEMIGALVNNTHSISKLIIKKAGE
jgi:hypothetical protein